MSHSCCLGVAGFEFNLKLMLVSLSQSMQLDQLDLSWIGNVPYPHGDPRVTCKFGEQL